jgi:hypothetical protein
MKKTISTLKFAVILLLLAGMMIACGKEKENEPTEIPFTEYSLTENCEWTNLNYDNKVIVINSETELENYVICTEGSFPEIDFAENTLLLVSGGAGSRNEFTYTLVKNSDNKYTLKVRIRSSALLPAVTPWIISVTTAKISDKSVITADIKETFN